MPVFDESAVPQIIAERDVEIPVSAVEIVRLVDPDRSEPRSPLRVCPYVIDAGELSGRTRLDVRVARPESDPRAPGAAVAPGNDHGARCVNEVLGYRQSQFDLGFIQRIRRRAEERRRTHEETDNRPSKQACRRVPQRHGSLSVYDDLSTSCAQRVRRRERLVYDHTPPSALNRSAIAARCERSASMRFCWAASRFLSASRTSSWPVMPFW